MDGKITEIDTVSLDEANKALVIIDQTKLPGTIEMLSLTTDRFTYGTGNLGCHLSVTGTWCAGNRCCSCNRYVCVVLSI